MSDYFSNSHERVEPSNPAAAGGSAEAPGTSIEAVFESVLNISIPPRSTRPPPIIVVSPAPSWNGNVTLNQFPLMDRARQISWGGLAGIPPAVSHTLGQTTGPRPSLQVPNPDTSITEVAFRKPRGVVRTKRGHRPNKIFTLRVLLDFPGQECNYQMSAPLHGNYMEITLVLSYRNSINAMDTRRFEKGFDWERGVVMDCGAQSGVWECEFPYMGYWPVDATKAVDIVAEEGNYGAC